jgi:uncharacterized protein YfaS (alpha-2-macroglobulin family)
MSASNRRWAWRTASAAAVGMTVAAMWGGPRSEAQVGPASEPGVACLTHVATDKPIYRGGERVYLRGVVLAAADNRPSTDGRRSAELVTIAGPKGETLAQGYAPVQDGVAAFAWDVPADAAGGPYTATFSSPWTGDPPAKRAFDVRAYRAPRLKGEIIYLRDGYGPGDAVRASMHVERAEGGLPAGAVVSATAVVDGVTVFTGATIVDAAGNCGVSFPLPADIRRGDGTLSLAVADGGVVEPIAKSIPIVLKAVDVNLYPEGGDLVAGLPGRVYVSAHLPTGKPADLAGDIVDRDGHVVATVETEHEGRGRFTFTPAAGQAYALRVSRPSGIDKPIPLPAVKPAGVVLTADADAIDGGAPVAMHLSSTSAGSYTVTLRKHQAELSAVTVATDAHGTAAVQLTPPGWSAGVLTVTVTDAAGTPVAERLVFRRPGHVVHVAVTPDRSRYVPGGPVHLTVATTDDAGKPVGAVVGVTVTDESVLKMIEKRDRAPRLAEMALLEDDVQQLADATAYLDPADAHAARDTDLLLATQGWRRFAEVDPAKFVAANGDAGRRALAIAEPPPMPTTSPMLGGGGGGFERDHAFALDDAAVPIAAAAAAPMGGVRNGAVARQAAAVAADGPVVVQKDAEAQDQLPADRLGPMVAGKAMRVRAFNPARRIVRPMPVVVREYAHELTLHRAPDQRTDFAETLYWAAGVKTDPATGRADVSFATSDAVTAFAGSADAVSADGALGEGDATVTSVRPFYVEPKLPLEVTAGDHVRLPLAAVNSGDAALSPVKLQIATTPGITVGPIDDMPSLAAGGRQRRVVDLAVNAAPGQYDLTVRATAGDVSDAVARHLRVAPAGFPVEVDHGGTLAANAVATTEFDVPASVVSGSVATHVALYPTPVGNLTAALQRLLQEPYGCFEQTSSTNYPLVMADQYFTTHTDVDPALVARTNELMDKGYDRLRGFECTDKGYEWFGENPGHECLTAYGLMEFTDMSAVRTVDPDMLARTRKWLLARRDGHGGYTHERRSLHTWITDPGCANGYCTWALLECGQTGLDPEVAWLSSDVAHDANSYVLALAANALFLAGDHDGAKRLMDQLAKLQDPDGHVRGATTSVVGSSGISLDVETTSLAVLAWLRDPAYADRAERAVHYLADACQDGRYGSTQSTVLALRAIVAYDKARAHPAAAGRVQFVVDGQPVGPAVPFDAKSRGTIELPDAASKLTAGHHRMELRMTDGSPLPFAMAVTYHCGTPASSDRCKVSLETHLASATLSEGDATEADVTVTNRSHAAVPTPVAIVGLPGGLEPRVDQLKELVSAGRIAAYEVRGREVILYWRSLDADQVVRVPLSLTAAVPGTYAGPASRAYLYYGDEDKQWQPGMTVDIAAR